MNKIYVSVTVNGGQVLRLPEEHDTEDAAIATVFGIAERLRGLVTQCNVVAQQQVTDYPRILVQIQWNKSS